MKRAKRALILLIVFVFLISLSACGKISSEKAIDIALGDLGITRVGAARTDAVLDPDSNPACYTVTINRNDHSVIYKIDAKTGDIISSETVPN